MKKRSKTCQCSLPRVEQLFDTINAAIDYCKTCKRKVVTKKDIYTGKINNREYTKTHRLDLLQPGGKDKALFEKEYGKPDDFEQEKPKILARAKEISDARTEKDLADIDRSESSSNRNLF